MANEQFILGMDGVTTINNVEVQNITDVTVNMDAEEADVTTRANKGWRGTAYTLKKCDVEFEMMWKPSDPSFQAVRNAYLNNGTVEMKVLDMPEAHGGEGPHGHFSIGNFSRKEPLTEAMRVTVKASLTIFVAWIGENLGSAGSSSGV